MTSKNATPGPETRFALVRAWIIDHGVHNYMPVLTAIDPALGEHADRIRNLWNSRSRVKEEDIPMLERMEKVVEHIKNATNAA